MAIDRKGTYLRDELVYHYLTGSNTRLDIGFTCEDTATSGLCLGEDIKFSLSPKLMT